VPILISEIHEGQPAERCKGLFIGDAILSVNGLDLRNAKHAEAVQVLSQQQGEIELEVVFVAPDEDSDDENHEYEDDNGFRYRIYDEDVVSDASGNSMTVVQQNGTSAADPAAVVNHIGNGPTSSPAPKEAKSSPSSSQGPGTSGTVTNAASSSTAAASSTKTGSPRPRLA
jgi:hypothetical protein